jgi:hypothetical protein
VQGGSEKTRLKGMCRLLPGAAREPLFRQLFEKIMRVATTAGAYAVMNPVSVQASI